MTQSAGIRGTNWNIKIQTSDLLKRGFSKQPAGMFDQAIYKGKKIKVIKPPLFEPLVKMYETIPFLIPILGRVATEGNTNQVGDVNSFCQLPVSSRYVKKSSRTFQNHTMIYR